MGASPQSKKIKKMKIPDELVREAGYILAHAAACLSKMGPGDALFPYAVAARNGALRILALEADSTGVAAHGARAQLIAQQYSMDGWALIADATIRSDDGSKTDALSVEIWARGMNDSVLFLQPYQPNDPDGFKLLGEGFLERGGNWISVRRARRYFSLLHEGTQRHELGKGFWPSLEEWRALEEKRDIEEAAARKGWISRLTSLWRR